MKLFKPYKSFFEMSRHKLKVGIDRNLIGIKSYFDLKRYNSIYFTNPEESDEVIHKTLNQKNITFFFTKNFDDFKWLPKKGYTHIGLDKVNRPADLMADIIEWLILNYSKLESKIGKVRNINNEDLKEWGCKK